VKARQAWHFARTYYARVIAISILLAVPCFWHKHIEAGDLPSHTYNAWLVHLIAQGQAPGLYLDSRWNNILVDLTLEKLGVLIGFVAAERILVLTSVLIFFWGAFALIYAANRHPPWTLTPLLAMITYGWTFYAGFMNFYLSIGLAFVAVALIWRGNRADWLVAAILTLLALLAHPLGFACLVGLALYLKLADSLRGWQRWSLPAIAFLALIALHFFVKHHLQTTGWYGKKFYTRNGLDQLVLFQPRYTKLAIALFAFAILCFAFAVLRDIKNATHKWTFRAPLELYALFLFTAAMIPETMWFADQSVFGLAISRLTSVTAVAGLCVLGSLQPRLWHLVGFTLCAVFFFVWTYQDTAILNNMEAQVQQMVSGLPYGRRLITTIHAGSDSRLPFIDHMVDRACIEKCFVYSNYEASAKQFRIRANPGSPMVTDSMEDAGKMEAGTYLVRHQDLPMNQIYQCDALDFSKLCMRTLVAGEQNGQPHIWPHLSP
jgi:hypothetical protein